jgi:histidyl-tRNA synthetase
MKKVIPPVKGTRDFYPEQMAVRTWIYNTARAVSESFGYQEYEAPMLESLACTFPAMNWSRPGLCFGSCGDQIALRPELTASLARMMRSAGTCLPVSMVVVRTILAMSVPSRTGA